MILFSQAKINLGLLILEKRVDGFHDLQSVMCPVELCDILEISTKQAGDKKLRFSQSGIRFDSDHENNLCIKAWNLFTAEAILPPVEIHLHKQIPVGAGLGGGSSNASTTLLGLNLFTEKPLSNKRLGEIAAKLGSDCPFFLDRRPMLMEGRGDILLPVHLNLDGLYLVILFPGIHVSTTEAYAGVIPAIPKKSLTETIQEPINLWKDLLHNDFENSLFKRFPQLQMFKKDLYNSGAIYASMSGSGSSLFGLYPNRPVLGMQLQKHVIWEGPIQTPAKAEP